MKITQVDTILLRVPLKQAAITDSQSHVDHVEFLQVSISTDDGITGWGMNWSYTTGLRAAQVCVDDTMLRCSKGATHACAKSWCVNAISKIISSVG